MKDGIALDVPRLAMFSAIHHLSGPVEPAARTSNGDRLVHDPFADAEILVNPFSNFLVFASDLVSFEAMITKCQSFARECHPGVWSDRRVRVRNRGRGLARAVSAGQGAHRKQQLTSDRSIASFQRGMPKLLNAAHIGSVDIENRPRIAMTIDQSSFWKGNLRRTASKA